MKVLIIAEKRNFGMDIAKAINPNAKEHKGYAVCNEEYTVTWASGHLLQLAPPEVYDSKYKEWSLDELPIIPEKFKTVVIGKNEGHQLNVIKDLVNKCSMVYNAADPDREGELIFYNLARFTGALKKPIKRLWVNSNTPQGIKKALDELKPYETYKPLLYSAIARSYADWLIGINASRAFSCKFNQRLPIGRVQQPVLAMIIDRQREVENFQSQTYFEVKAYFEQGDSSYHGIWQGEQIIKREEANKIAQKVKDATGKIIEYKKEKVKKQVPLLLNLTDLTSEANKKIGLTAKETLEIAQALYNNHKCITYPRTSSNYVQEAEIPQMREAYDAIQKSQYGDLTKGGNPDLVTIENRRVCRPEKVEGHYAILPTDMVPAHLSEKEKAVYEIVLHRFIAQFYPPAEYLSHLVVTEVKTEAFRTSFEVLISPGWQVLYTKKSDDSVPLELFLDPSLSTVCLEAELVEKETSPPKLFTEGTLIKAMERGGKSSTTEDEDENIIEALKDKGIGTAATRPDIIERLKANEYIAFKNKKSLIATTKGIQLIELLLKTKIQSLCSPQYTGEWEYRLKLIHAQKYSSEKFLDAAKKFTQVIVEEVKTLSSDALPRADQRNLAPCPSCSEGQIIEGKKAYYCSRWKEECHYKVWKEIAGKKVTEKQVILLIEKGETGFLKFKNKQKGTTYEAKFKIKDPKTGEVELGFKNRKPV